MTGFGTSGRRIRQSASLLALGALLGVAMPPLVHAGPASSELRAADEATAKEFLGVWAVSDDQNNLFNLRLFPGGKAVSTVGTGGVPLAGARHLTAEAFSDQGRWQLWGNGVRIDFRDGWSDWIYVGPSGLTHASWRPGQSRSTVPSNFGTAVKLSGTAAEAVGIYRFPPAQSELPPYTAALLSNGLAFNNIDSRAGGVWKLVDQTVVIDWISGWRTSMSLAAGSRLQLQHWAPGTDRNGPPTATRQGTMLQ
jgi:hypothetical protein